MRRTITGNWANKREAKVCFQCGYTFGGVFVGAPHICKSCGDAVCGRCSTHRLDMSLLGYALPQRVCDTCFEEPLPIIIVGGEEASEAGGGVTLPPQLAEALEAAGLERLAKGKAEALEAATLTPAEVARAALKTAEFEAARKKRRWKPSLVEALITRKPTVRAAGGGRRLSRDCAWGADGWLSLGGAWGRWRRGAMTPAATRRQGCWCAARCVRACYVRAPPA